MYSYCDIAFVDDSILKNAIIKAYNSEDINDDMIFYYGLSRDELVEACQNSWVFDNEWKIIAVYETVNNI